jgi:PAS domain S-box-containing protein
MNAPKEPPRVLLEQVREHFRLVVDGVEDYAIFLLDTHGYIRSWNTGAQRVKGYTAAEIVGQHFSRFYREEDRRGGKLEMELAQAASEGHYREEGWRVRKDGSLFWASVLISAVRDPSGELTGFVKVTRDLTERRAAEEALRRSEERFRLLVASVQDYAIFMLDVHGNVASWNQGAERIKGYRADEIIGRHFSVFYPEDDVRSGKPARELEVATTVGRYEEEGTRVRKDGSTFTAHVFLTAIRDERGELRGFAKVTRDITQRQRAEEQRLALAREQAARAEAEKASRMKDEFLAILSHELRTPLNAIVGWTELLRSRSLSPEQEARAIEIVERNARVQTQLVSDVLDLSRVSAGRLRLAPRRLDLRGPVTAAVDTLRPAAAAKQITLDVDLGDARWVWGDADRLQQVAWNLLSNAVKFTPRAGRVALRLGGDDDEVELVVEDTGAGIAPEFLPYAFERFRQEDASARRAHGGLGLGLAIVRHLAELHGGQVQAESAGPGLGSRFSLRLPAARREDPAPSEDAAPKAARLDGIRVLIVEDHEDSRGLITLALTTLGAAVAEARDADQGLAHLLAARPDVIVADIEMPGRSGYEFMEQVRALPPDLGGLVPAIALTAYARTEDRVRALAAGFQVHMAKPVAPAGLAAAVAALVARPPQT